MAKQSGLKAISGLGKSRQVGGNGNPGMQAIGSWAGQVKASLGKPRQAGGDGKSWNAGYWQLG